MVRGVLTHPDTGKCLGAPSSHDTVSLPAKNNKNFNMLVVTLHLLQSYTLLLFEFKDQLNQLEVFCSLQIMTITKYSLRVSNQVILRATQ